MSPAPPNASFSIIAIGNPGSGKSTTLNYLAQSPLFKSGVSIGTGMTYELDKKVVELRMNGKSNQPESVTVTFYDTPGLNDAGKREAAGKAITEALKKGGKTKVIFFVGQESGRPKEADVATMKLVLEACPEIENTYGIIVPKITRKMKKKLTDETKFIDPDTKQETDAWTKFLGGIFNSVKKNICAPVNVQGIQFLEELEEEDDAVADPGELKTLEDNTLEDFVFYVLQFIDLTVGGRKDFKAVDTSRFDEQSAEIAKLIAEAGKQQKMMAELQAQVAASRKTDYFKEFLNGVATVFAPLPTLLAKGAIAGIEKIVEAVKK